MKNVIKQEGSIVAAHYAKTLEKCKKHCGRNGKCKSFAYVSLKHETCTTTMACQFGNCHLKDKYVNPTEPQKVIGGYKTYYKDCKGKFRYDIHVEIKTLKHL